MVQKLYKIIGGIIMETIKINKILENKEKFMDLLLLGDEQENMIKKYLYRGELFALYNNDLKTICVVTKEEDGIYEIKNIATYEKYQGKGYGKYMVKYVIENHKNKCNKLYVGTGDNEKILSFYKSCGFTYSHTVKDFFIKNYDHKIYEDGKQLVDMIYLKIEYNK
jgi:GNAT superfamily N-acetyltransferase